MNKKLKLVTIVTSIFFTFLLIIIAVKFTLNFRPLYYFDIDYFNIPQETHMTKTEIINNYDTLIDYLKTFNHNDLKFPTLAMSESGKIHFEDVKIIFVTLDYFMYFSLIVLLIGICYLFKHKHYLFFRYTSLLMIGIPIFLFLPLVIYFNEIFTFFHHLVFRNNYWQFDPNTDPVINILPQGFFMHSAILILIIIVLESLLLNYLYHLYLKRYFKKNSL